MSREEARETLEDALARTTDKVGAAALVGRAYPEIADHVAEEEAYHLAEGVLAGPEDERRAKQTPTSEVSA